MQTVRTSVITVAALMLSAGTLAADFATSVIGYNPGVGFATDFSTGAGYTNALTALGEPSRVTPGLFGGPVDPFNPPYLREQVVSIGVGGSLTLGFGTPIQNRAGNPFGVDFIIFGNSGFVITNGDFSGGGITDGSLFSANEGTTRVSVSADNVNWFTLDPSKASVADTLFPTDGVGSFTQPVNPSLKASDFAGLDLAGIRGRYAGAGGGTGYDLSWSLDDAGNHVDLSAANFIRIEVLTGRAEIDGVSIVPEPGVRTLALLGVVVIAFARGRGRS
ncbi:MAG: hypothetical protein EXS31_11135 [Pedosphaera sp.]|nr:hypothetical protein [Pedosphaera sp.]